jgi:hypothetical protein
MEPLDPQRPCDFHITFDSADGSHNSFFTVDTEVSEFGKNLTDTAAKCSSMEKSFRGDLVSSCPSEVEEPT